MTVLAVVGAVGVVAVVLAVGLLIDRRWPILPRRAPERGRATPPPPGPGEAPTSAIRAGPGARRRRVARHRCECGERVAAGDEEPVRLGTRTLLVVRLTCAACGVATSVYFDPGRAWPG